MANIITSVNTIINGVIIDLAENAAKAAIIADCPFFGWPIVNFFFNYFFDLGSNYFSNAIQQGADLTIINTQTDAEKTTYAKAEAALRAIHANGNQDAIKIATDNFRLAVAPIIHFDTVKLLPSLGE